MSRVKSRWPSYAPHDLIHRGGEALQWMCHSAGVPLCCRCSAQAPGQGFGGDGRLGRELFVGQAEEQLLAGRQVGLFQVDAAVGDDATGHLDGRPCAVGPPGQQFAADGVTDVMGEQGEPGDPPLRHEGHGQIGLEGHGVVQVRLGREPVPETIEQEHAGRRGAGRRRRRSRRTRWETRAGSAVARALRSRWRAHRR